MPKPKSVFEYGYEQVNKLSDWPANRLFQDQTRGDINMDDLASIAVWLAANGKPWLRAKMFSKLAPDVFGTGNRSASASELIDAQTSPELMSIVFAQSVKPRKKLGKKKGVKS